MPESQPFLQKPLFVENVEIDEPIEFDLLLKKKAKTHSQVVCIQFLPVPESVASSLSRQCYSKFQS